jgi:putative nucleotidyltransferase with HDIG domain
MSFQKRQLTFYLRNIPHFFRYGMLALFVLFISLFFSNNIQVDYHFNQGENWKYDDLRAPFSFPIQKSKNDLEREKRFIERDFLPHYRLDKTLLEKQKERLNKEIAVLVSKYRKENKGNIDSAKFNKLGNEILEKIYEKHVIKTDSQAEKSNRNISFTLIENQVELGEYNSRDFLDQKKATQFVIDSIEKVKTRLSNSEILLNILAELVLPDIAYDEELTKKNKESALKNLSPVRDKINAGELIIRKGDLIDTLAYSKLISYRYKYEQELNKHKSGLLIFTGYLALIIALLVIFCLFIYIYARDVFDNLQHFMLIFALIGVFSYLAFSIDSFYLSLYFIPFCIVPIIVKNFFSPQLALFTHLVMILLISVVLSLDYHFIITQIIAGMVAVMTRRNIRYMTDFFVSVFYIGIAYLFSYLCTELLDKGVIFPVSGSNGQLIEQGILWSNVGWIGLNILLTLLSYPFIPLLERAFGLISEITLIELSDLNKPLLRELSFKAPGTMQHSIQVSNLAEAAANSIGANALLVKVGALYHDIGKMQNPQFFIENQLQSNLHLELSYQESAKMIISHVTEGIKLAKKYRLPSVLVDFISTHHGTTKVEYFYRMYKNENPEKQIDETEFTYPGPKPRNKEEVILMLADSIEAASKSFKNPAGKEIDLLVDNIVTFKINHGQLQDSNLTFSELDTIKAVFKKLLRSIYHVRVEYPEQKLF